ncbi:hypothetical protein ACSBR1_007247 [Camellia fascicularis]
MRIMIKGGVWKNTEDEILKAAVMKYGKNQWARISSLLVRKSAKQCKARWQLSKEGNDIDKNEHLPFLGLKVQIQYNSDIDDATNNEKRLKTPIALTPSGWPGGKALGLAGVLPPSNAVKDISQHFLTFYLSSDFCSKLQCKQFFWTREEDEKLLHLAKLMPTQWRTIAPIVGRIPSQCLERYEKLLDGACAKDENYEAESKPARPDPVDMDKDEKEMLSEAQAQLANTRGKKAKRKAREKQLEFKLGKGKGRGRVLTIMLKFPLRRSLLQAFLMSLMKINQWNSSSSLPPLKNLRRQDAPSAILQANKLNDPETVRKRSKLMLPAPQISDNELEEIAKMGYTSDLLVGSEELIEGNGATCALLANYAQTPRQGMTPLRTPQRTPVGKGDAIMMEAENLAKLRVSDTVTWRRKSRTASSRFFWGHS